MAQGTLLSELKRRNVIRMAGLYLVGAWLLVQVVSTIAPMFNAPPWLPRSIVTLLAVGFLPALVFSWVFELTPEGLKRESAIERDESITPQTGQRMDRAIIVVLTLALVYFGFDKFVLAPRRDAALVAATEQRVGAAPAATAMQSIAVLPLANSSGDKEQQFFSDGLSENLIVALSQFSGLKVIGRNSSFRFRDSNEDSKTIGEKLGVATLLEGSVQHAGDGVRVSAELIRAADGVTLWSQRYDRPYKDLFALQDEITQAVAGELKAKLMVSEARKQTDRPPSGNIEAYAAYLRGREHEMRNTEADLHAALDSYAEAIRLDPGYALAHAASSRAGMWLAGQFLGGEQAARISRMARDEAEMALRLDPQLAAGYTARAIQSSVSLDMDRAGADYRRALELSPNDVDALQNLSVDLASRGKPELAVAQVQRAIAIDPLYGRAYLLLARYQSGLGRFDDARQTILKAIALEHSSGIFDAVLTTVEVQRGDAAAAQAAADRALPGLWQEFAQAMARQIGGNRAAADAALQVLVDHQAQNMGYQIAEVYALRRDADQTFAWLDRALANRDPGLQFLPVDPFLLRFRDDPRYAAFCRKANLAVTTTAKALP
jgi:serine/threonine-protein kinase